MTSLASNFEERWENLCLNLEIPHTLLRKMGCWRFVVFHRMRCFENKGAPMIQTNDYFLTFQSNHPEPLLLLPPLYSVVPVPPATSSLTVRLCPTQPTVLSRTPCHPLLPDVLPPLDHPSKRRHDSFGGNCPTPLPPPTPSRLALAVEAVPSREPPLIILRAALSTLRESTNAKKVREQ